MSSVTHRDDVSSVSETSGKLHFRTCPAVCPFLHTEVKSSARVCPGVIGVVEIVQPASITCNRAHIPIVTAEFERLCGRHLDGANALHRLNQGYGAPCSGGHVCGRRRLVAGID